MNQIQVKIEELNKEQLSQYRDLIKVFSIVMKCKKCNIIFGLDKFSINKKNQDDLCPICDPRYKNAFKKKVVLSK